MRTILLIARRELAAYLRTMSGYVIIAAILAVEGLLFNAFVLSGSSKLSGEVLSAFFYVASGGAMFAAVFLSMRLLAEERQSGTLALLYSSPVRDVEIVVGKYLSAFGMLALMTLLTVYMPALILVNGKISAGHIFAGYVGVLLLGSATVAIGTFGSVIAKNQVLAVIISGCMVITLLIFWMLARVTERPLSDVFSAMALHSEHFQPFQSGVIHVRDVVYYVVVTYVALFASTRILEARRWR
jgi:ABC-2 type transport system permease protein